MAGHFGAIAQGVDVGCAGFQQAVGDNTAVDLNAGSLRQVHPGTHTHRRNHQVRGNGLAIVEADHHALVGAVHRRHQRSEVESGTLFFQRSLHRLACSLRQQGGQAVAQRVDRFHLEAAVEKVVGELAADQAAADDADPARLVPAHHRAEVIVIQQVVDRIDQLLCVTLYGWLDGLGAQRQYQLAVMDRGFRIPHPDDLLGGVDVTDPGHGPDAGLQLLGHGTGIELDQVVGTGFLGVASGQHGLGVGAAVIGADQDKRCFAVVLAELLGHTVAGQASADDNHRRMDLVRHRFLVVRRLVNGRFLNQLEIFLADATIGAQPVLGHVFPLGARRNAIIRPAVFLVVDQATDYAFPLAHKDSRSNLLCGPPRPGALPTAGGRSAEIRAQHYRVV